MKLTYEDTRMLETPKGGFKASTLRMLGIEWPPKSGWRDSLVGKEIAEDVFARAITDSESPKKPKGIQKREDALNSEGQTFLI